MWKSNTWCMGIKFFIFLFMFIFCLNLVVCQSILIDYPEKVELEKEFDFEVELIDFEEGVYDVKIDINPEDRIAQIWNGADWQTTYRFVVEAIKSSDKSAEIKMKIVENVEGDFPIVIKIRNSEGKSEVFEGYKIEVSKQGVKQEDEEEEKTEEENEDEDDEKEQEVEEEKTEEESEEEEQEIIYLSPQNIKKENQVLYESNNEKIKIYAIYGFALFCVLMVILLFIDSKK